MNQNNWKLLVVSVLLLVIAGSFISKETSSKTDGLITGDTLQKIKNIEPYPFISGSFYGPRSRRFVILRVLKLEFAIPLLYNLPPIPDFLGILQHFSMFKGQTPGYIYEYIRKHGSDLD
jgi:hypothetical protein